MELDWLLHVLRNPWGHSEEAIKEVRLAAADLLERQDQEITVLINRLSLAIAKDHFEPEWPKHAKR